MYFNNSIQSQSILTDYDLYLFSQGTHYKIYDKLGAHYVSMHGIEGTFFAVWAPHAKRISVVGDFNGWDGNRHQMAPSGSSGIWTIFIPQILEGNLYKYELLNYHGKLVHKSDPYAFYSELRPKTASVVYNLDNYHWNDSLWMEERSKEGASEKPLSIYELHLGSWSSCSPDGHIPLSYRQHADKLINYIKYMGYSYIELMPVMEHPFDGSWGYQVTGYYSLTSRFGNPEGFMYLVDRCHQEGIGVILDWVPAHFATDSHSLCCFDGTPLYEQSDPYRAETSHWGTYLFNYSRNEVKNFLIGSALFWLDKYHIDGLRVDAVSSMLCLNFFKDSGHLVKNGQDRLENLYATEFIRHLNSIVRKYFPGTIMIAEESTSWKGVTSPFFKGGLGFTFKWNMGWMHDFLKYLTLEPQFRRYNSHLITFSMHYNYNEKYILIFSHDEVVNGKSSMINKILGDYCEKFATLRAAYGFMFAHPGKKLLFMGNDFGQFIEWNHNHSLDWHLLEYDMHKKLLHFVRDLNFLYKTEKALYELDSDPSAFEWIDCNSNSGIISFIRKGKSSADTLIFIFNFSVSTFYNYRIGVPFLSSYFELLNSQSELYGGNNIGNFGSVNSIKNPCNNRLYSLNLSIPELSALIFKPVFS